MSVFHSDLFMKQKEVISSMSKHFEIARALSADEQLKTAREEKLWINRD